MNSFYRLSRELFTNERYAKIPTDAKILYAILHDRMELSEKNGLRDKAGRVCVYYPIAQLSELLGFCKDKIIKLFRVLEAEDLIERKRQGLGKASVIYVKEPKEVAVDFQKAKNTNFRERKKGTEEDDKTERSYIEYNHTEDNYTEQSIIDVDEIEKQVKQNIEYDILSERLNRDLLDEIVMIITELMCIETPSVKIGKDRYPGSLVHKRMSELNDFHIEYVLDCMQEKSAKISDIKAYLISALFNAPSTMNHYIQAQINYDYSQNQS